MENLRELLENAKRELRYPDVTIPMHIGIYQGCLKRRAAVTNSSSRHAKVLSLGAEEADHILRDSS
jgi:hypothetical protein